MKGIKQNDHQSPEGPVIMSPDWLMVFFFCTGVFFGLFFVVGALHFIGHQSLVQRM